ncbi:MAG: SBBP repeat-containing protein [Candidatus Binataceae bacterium]
MPVDSTAGNGRPGKTTIAIVAVALMVGAAAIVGTYSVPNRQTAIARHLSKADAAAKIEGMPLYFETNQGQTDASVQYLAHAGDYTLFLTRDAAIFSIIGGDRVGVANRNNPIAMAQRSKVDPKNQPKLLFSAVRIRLVGASQNATVAGTEALPGKVNYLIGNDQSKWHRNIPTFGRIRYAGVYPGVDLVFYGTPDKLEYDLIVKPGADTSKIKFAVEGPATTSLMPSGDLLIATAAGNLVMRQPRVYQQAHDGTQTPVEGKFTIGKDGMIEAGIPRREVGFDLASYDRSQTLVIDPQVVPDVTVPQIPYSTYLGGAGDSSGPIDLAQFGNIPGINDLVVSDVGLDVAVDTAGDAYTGGIAFSSKFPTTTGAFQTSNNGANSAPNQNPNAWVAKFDPTKSGAASLIYSTYIGGSGNTTAADAGNGDGDQGYGITVDSVGKAYLVGLTYSTNFPGAPSCGFPSGRTNNQGATDVNNGFVTQVNSTGTGVVSCYINGSDGAPAIRVAIHGSTLFIVGASTTSNSGGAGTDFPSTASAFQPENPDLPANGNSAAYFIAMPTSLASISYASFYGGKGTGTGGEAALAVTADPSGNAWITGLTYSSDDGVFPLVNAFQSVNNAFANDATNAFVAKFDPSLSGSSSLPYSSFFGGQGVATTEVNVGEAGTGIALDTAGHVFVTGYAFSTGLVTTGGSRTTPYQASNNAAANEGANAFILELDPTNAGGLQALYESYLGGSGTSLGFFSGVAPGGGDLPLSMALDSDGNVYLTGATTSAAGSGEKAFPTTTGVCGAANNSSGISIDGLVTVPVTAFVAKLNPAGGATGLLYSTYLGGTGMADVGSGVALDPFGNVFVSGVTYSSDFPITSNAFQITNNAAGNSSTNAFLTEIDPAGSICPTPFPSPTATSTSATPTATPTPTVVPPTPTPTVVPPTPTPTVVPPTPTPTVVPPTPTPTVVPPTPTSTVVPPTPTPTVVPPTPTPTVVPPTPTATPTPSGGVLSVSPNGLSFAPIARNHRETLRFVVTNTGGSQLTGYVTPLRDDGFRVVKGGGKFSLAPGQSRTVVVAFRPPFAGSFTSNVLVVSENPAQQLSVTLTGVGQTGRR